MGVVPTAPLPTYPDGFPPDVVAALEQATGLRFCANRPGERHRGHRASGASTTCSTGEVILYTSADSVLQLAAHDDVLSRGRAVRARARAAREVMTGEHAVGPRDRAAVRRASRAPSSAPRGARTSRSTPPARSYLDELQDAGVAGPRRRQGPRPLRRRRHRRAPPGRDERARRSRRSSELLRDLDARPRLHEPRRDRPGLRPPQGRRGLPPRAARDRRRRRRLARAAARRRPARADRRPRRRPARAAHRPHARARAAAGRASRARTAAATTARWPTSARASCAGSRAASAPELPGRRSADASASCECPSCPRSRRSAASSRPLVEGRVARRAWRSSTRAGACRWRPRRVVDAVEGRRDRAARPPRQVPRAGSSRTRSFLLMHLRMTGTLLYDPPPDAPYERVRFAPRRRPRAALLRPAPLRHRRARARRRGARRLLRRAPRRRAARRRAHRRARCARWRAGAARRSRRSCSTSGASPASGTSTPTRRCSARASIRCARPAALTRAQCDALARRGARGAPGRARGAAARRSTTSATPTASRAPSRTSSSSTCARASRARAAARRSSSSSPPGAGPTSASAASRVRGAARRRPAQ